MKNRVKYFFVQETSPESMHCERSVARLEVAMVEIVCGLFNVSIFLPVTYKQCKVGLIQSPQNIIIYFRLCMEANDAKRIIVNRRSRFSVAME